MSKGGKRYFNKNKSGNWFIHADTPKTEQPHELCTSPGSMLTRGAPHPQTQEQKRYPKIFMNPEKKTMGRDYPVSVHNNRAGLLTTIEGYDQGLGRKKCLYEHRQHNSHFRLCDHNTPLRSDKWDHSTCQTDFLPRQETGATEATIKRRFPRKHSATSLRSAAAQAGQCFMWFGRDDLKQHISLSVLATSNQ